MTQIKKHIWYASYGSNLLEERFLCYIKGGKPSGSSKRHDGCFDKTLPQNNAKIYINHELYFARKSKSWDNGGVAFLSEKFESNHKTLGRMYLITPDQFTEVVKQEIDFEGTLELDFDKAIEENRKWGVKTGNKIKTDVALAHIYASAGRKDEARAIIEETGIENILSSNDFRGVALVYAALGDNDQAFEWLEKSLEKHEESLCSLKIDQKFEGLCEDPRFDELVEKIGLG